MGIYDHHYSTVSTHALGTCGINHCSSPGYPLFRLVDELPLHVAFIDGPSSQLTTYSIVDSIPKNGRHNEDSRKGRGGETAHALMQNGRRNEVRFEENIEVSFLGFCTTCESIN